MHTPSNQLLHRSMTGAVAMVACAIVVWVSACAVGPEFQRPVVATNNRYAATASEPLAIANPELASQHVAMGGVLPSNWWRLFKSDALNQLIEQALHNNFSLAAAQATVQQAQALAEASTGARLPQVDVTASSGREKYGAQFLGGFAPPPPFTYYAFGAAVSYSLDYTGGVARSIEQQRAQADYQQQQWRAAQLTVAGNVVLRAIEIAALQSEIQTIDELLTDDHRNLEMIQAAFDAGSVSRVDVLSAEAQLARDTTLLPPVAQRLGTARNALSVLTGREPAAPPPANFALTAFELPQQLPVNLPSDLVHERPDILAAEAQLHAATAAVGVATANLYPRITLSASLGQQALEPDELFNQSSSAWGLIAGMTAPVFDGGRLRAERRAAVAALSAEAARYQQVVLESFVQVADALDAINRSAELLAAESRALTVAQQSLDLTRESFNEGNADVLQVLYSERLYQQARLGYVRAQAQRLQTTAQLFAAVAHGGNADGEQQAPNE